MKDLFKVSIPAENVLFFEFKNQYYLTSTFMRMQEFYESPFKSIRGKFFTHEQYMDIYANNQKSKTFTYYTDWSGFNVPGSHVREFRDLFDLKKDDLTKREKKLLEAIGRNIDENDFYVIGAVEGNTKTLDHETCHALYYMHPEFKSMSNHLIDDKDVLPQNLKGMFIKALIKHGYDDSVAYDEVNAYLSKSTAERLRKVYSIDVPQKVLDIFHRNFEAFKRDLKRRKKKEEK